MESCYCPPIAVANPWMNWSHLILLTRHLSPLPADPLPPPSLQAMRNPKYLEREIFNQYKLRHPHIIRLLDVS